MVVSNFVDTVVLLEEFGDKAQLHITSVTAFQSPNSFRVCQHEVFGKGV